MQLQEESAAPAGAALLEFGMSPRQFRARHFEQQPFVRKAAMLARPFKWTDVDVLLQQIEPVHPFIKLFNNGELPEETYAQDTLEFGLQRRRLNKAAFYRQMKAGATLVFNRLENFSVAAQRLCQEVGRFAGHQTNSNAYLTFGGNGTFGKHWDVHDVFAVQLIGRKRWRVFAPTLPLPLSHQTSDLQRGECPPNPVMEVTLEAGDLLYLPRGWWHQVIPFEEGSFHISVGAYAPTVADYIAWACNVFLPASPAARAALTTDVNGLDHVAAALKYLSGAIAASAPIAEFAADVAARERLNSQFNVEQFLQPASRMLASNAILSLNGASAPRNGAAQITVNAITLQLDPLGSAIVELLATHPALRFGELCGKLPHARLDAVHATVLELAQHDVLNVHVE